MDSNIIGKSHLEYVQDQIKVRQAVLGKKSKTSSDIAWMNGKTSWVRLASSVNIQNEDIASYNVSSSKWEVVSNDGAQFRATYLELPEYSGAELASQMVLQGGTLNQDGSQKYGVANTNSILPSNGFNYGFSEFGAQAMPGIISFTSETSNKGSLRFANLQIRANNTKQFEYIEALYLRLGYTMLLEWGNSSYPYLNNETGQTSYETNRSSLTTNFLSDPPQGAKGTKYFYTQIEKLRKQTHGNYDGFLGTVQNFSWEFTKEGYYLISVRLISLGSVIESLKINIIQNASLSLEKDKKTAFKKNQKQNVLLNNIDTITNPIRTGVKFKPAWFSSYAKFGLPGSPMTNLLLSYVFDAAFDPSFTFKSIKSEYEVLKSRKQSGDTSITDEVLNKASKTIDACAATYGSTNFVKYIRFGTLLSLLNERFLLYGEDESNEPILFKLDTSVNQFCFSNKKSISSDPSKLVVRYKGEFLNTEIEIFNDAPNNISPFHQTEEGVDVGRIMNLYFSYDFLESVITNNTDEENGTLDLYKLLKSLLNEANILLGGVNKLNLRLVDKNFGDYDNPSIEQVIEFYDEVSPFEVEKLRKVKEEEPNLVIYGFGNEVNGSRDGSFVTDYNFKTEITKNLSNMIAVGAQANGQSVGEDATLFSKWNYGLVDRVLPKKLDIDQKIKKADETTVGYLNLVSTYQDYVLSFAGASSQTITKENDIFILSVFIDLITNITGYNFPNCNITPIEGSDTSLVGFTETQKSFFQKYYSLEAIGKKSPTPFIGFIPVGLNLTLDGLSGIRIFDRLKIDSRFLPPNYSDTLDFIITKLDHKIINNKWETTIGTMSIPKLFDKLSLNLESILNTLPPVTTGFEDLVGYFGYQYSALGSLILESIYYVKDNPGLGTGDTIRRNTNGNLPLPEENLGEGFQSSPLVEIGTSSRNSGSYGWLRVNVPGKGWVTSKGLYLANAPGYKGTNGTGTWHLAEPAALKLLEFAQFCEQKGKSYQINSAYRTYAEQEAGYNKNPKTHAKPGGSPHGLGGAIDIQQLISRSNGKLTSNPTINQTFRNTNVDYKFWAEHAPKFGWYNPLRLKDGNGMDETWHWEFWGIPGEGLQIKPPTNDGFLTTIGQAFDVKYLGFTKVPNTNGLNVHEYNVYTDEETGKLTTGLIEI